MIRIPALAASLAALYAPAFAAPVTLTLEQTYVSTTAAYASDADFASVTDAEIVLSFDTDDLGGVPGVYTLATAISETIGLAWFSLSEDPVVSGDAAYVDGTTDGVSFDIGDTLYNVVGGDAYLAVRTQDAAPILSLADLRAAFAAPGEVVLELFYEVGLFDASDACERENDCRYDEASVLFVYELADAAVPLPGAMLFFASGLVGAAGLRGRRRLGVALA